MLLLVDPPFYQKQSDSSNEETNIARNLAYPHTSSIYHSTQFKPPIAAHSSSADDFRSVIDDLTVENKRLKEELRRYKQFGPDPLRKDRLFEIKFHGLPIKKKKELEATLRDFASSLEGSTTSSQQRKKASKHVSRLQGSSSNSKHASSASSHSRPVDSAYASMSTGPSSIGPNTSMNSVWRPSLGRARSSADQRAENVLRDIPQGLMPRHVALTDKEKKKVVVRRLEQLFTGKLSGRNRNTLSPSSKLEPELSNGGGISAPLSSAPPSAPPLDEPSREARIQLHDSLAKSHSRGELSVSNCNGDNETGENRTGSGSGSGSNDHSNHDNSPQNAGLPEQRATRPLDLDPDRTQIPAENMDYIRHLGAMAPEYLPQAKYKSQDVSMDADGWIHLNLLCNLAQLHILNVTPDYIRSAVSERSAKFQLSRDGRKIRWRGGTHGTKFSSDSSGESSQRSPDTVTTDGSNEDGQRKKQKTGAQASSTSNTSQAKLNPKTSASDGFHYKPMFAHHQSSSVETSVDETGSQGSYPAVENSNLVSHSTDFVSGSGSSLRKKRRRDGGIIYYTGAPFCLDLSGDPGDVSPTTHMASGQVQGCQEDAKEMPQLVRTASGSHLPFRPLVDGPELTYLASEQNIEYVLDDTDNSDIDDEKFSWCEQPEKTQLKPLQACLEPCGLGGVTPEDHFAILVVTRHPMHAPCSHRSSGIYSEATTDLIANRIAALTTDSPRTPSCGSRLPAQIQCQVLQQRYKELKPLPLPPPAIFYPPFTDTTDSEDDSGFEDDYEDGGEDDSDAIMDDSDEAISQRANPYQSDNDFARMADLNSDEDEDEFSSAHILKEPQVAFASGRKMSKSSIPKHGGVFNRGVGLHPDSSAATAGEASGYSSGREESG